MRKNFISLICTFSILLSFSFIQSGSALMPNVSDEADFSMRESDIATITWQVSNGNGYYFSVILDSSYYTYTLSPITSNYAIYSVQVTGLSVGIHSLYAIVTNAGGSIIYSQDDVQIDVKDDNYGDPPVTTHPDDQIIWIGKPNNYLTWTITDNHIPANSNYSVFLDQQYYTGYANITYTISPVNISINLDNLTLGSHVFNLIVQDYMYAVSDDVQIMVSENAPPQIIAPDDFYIVFETDYNDIHWQIIDYSLVKGNYSVFIEDQIWKTFLNKNFTKNVQDLYITIDGLDVGIYEFTIQVGDGFNPFVYDSVLITVYPDFPPLSFQFASLNDTITTNSYNLTWDISEYADYYTIYVYYSPITKLNASLILIATNITTNYYYLTDLDLKTYYFIIVATNEILNTTSSNTFRLDVLEKEGLPLYAYILIFSGIGIGIGIGIYFIVKKRQSITKLK